MDAPTFARVTACVMAVGALVPTGAAHAAQATYPTKPIRLVLPFPPGGGTDALARIISPKLTDLLGQTIVIDNRSGASGNIANEIVARAAPDGYTLLLAFSTTLTVNPLLYGKLPFSVQRDLAPITQLGTAQFLLVLHPSVPAKSVKELILLAKEKPGQLNYSSSGVGGPLHLAAELFKQRAGVNMVHVAYKGGGPAAAAVLGGEVQILFGSVASTLPHVRAGKLRALAVTSTKRHYLLPELPTLDESGFPGFNVTGWDGVLAPARTPPTIITRLHDEIIKVLQMPDTREFFSRVGYEATGTTPEQFTAIIRAETATWAKVIKEANIRAE